MGYHYSPKIVTDGLVLYLDAGNSKSYTSGSTTWYDISKTGNNGLLVSGVGYTTANKGGMTFNGTSNHISFSDTTIGSFNTPEFSIGCWFYFNNVSQAGSLVSKRNEITYQQYNLLISNNSLSGAGKYLNVVLYPDNGLLTSFTYDISSFGARFYYLITTVSTLTQKYYLNGVNLFTNNVNLTGKQFNFVNKPLYIGASNYTGNVPGLFFNGNIYNVHMYNRALTQSEVTQNFNALRGRFNI